MYRSLVLLIFLTWAVTAGCGDSGTSSPDSTISPSETADAPEVQGKSILVWGPAKEPRARMVSVVATLGHTVTDSAMLPADLAGFDVIFSALNNNAILSAPQQALLVSFVLAGGGLYLNGENDSSFAALNDSVITVVNALVRGGGIGKKRGGMINGPFTFNAGAAAGIALLPKPLKAFTAANAGNLTGVANSNILVSGAAGIPAGAWSATDMVAGKGALILILDMQWTGSAPAGETEDAIENFLRFLTDFSYGVR